MAPPRHLTGTALTLVMAATTLAFLSSILFVRHWSHPREREPLISITTVLALTLALVLASCSLPIDALLVSLSTDPHFGTKLPWADPDTLASLSLTISYIYDFSFFTLLSFTTILVPFVYFYFEEYDDNVSTSKRLAIATRFTLAGMIVFTILLACGLLLRPTNSLPPNTPINWDFLKKALMIGGFETSLLFILAVAMMAGAIMFVVYTASGLFLFPIHMLKPAQSLHSELHHLATELNQVQADLDNLRLQFPDQSAMTSRDLGRWERLQELERILQRKAQHVQSSQPTWYTAKLSALFFPVKILCLVLSGCIIVAILSTILTRPPDCPSCPRLVLPITSPANPIDIVLQVLAHAQPLNHIAFASIIVYLLACTLHGIRVLGIRVLWVKMYSIRPRKTMPQGLLLVAVVLILVMLSLMWEMTSVVSPSYSTWGSQRYCPVSNDLCENDPSLVRFCDINAPSHLCTPTTLSLLLARVALGTPVFSAAFFWVQPASVVVALLTLIYGIFSARQSRATDVHEDDSEDEDDPLGDEERTRLLANSRA